MLLETPVSSAAPKAAAAKPSGHEAKVAPPEDTRPVETRPVDPNSFAYWLAEKQYTVKHKQTIGESSLLCLIDGSFQTPPCTSVPRGGTCSLGACLFAEPD